jgi:hypothetical protein
MRSAVKWISDGIAKDGKADGILFEREPPFERLLTSVPPS